MKITVEFLGRLKNKYSGSIINLDLLPGTSIEELINIICEQYNNNSLKEDTFCLVNGTHFDQYRVLADGDKVIFSYVIFEG